MRVARKRAGAWWLVVPLLLLAAWLGARGLNADPIWSDEYYSIFDAGGTQPQPSTVGEIWQRVATRNPWHTPGFFIVLSGWGRLVGWDPAVLRALALLFGLLAVAWTYRLGREHVSPAVGLYAAAILVTSLYFAYYLHEIRMYTLIVGLTAYTTWAYLRLLDAPRLTWPGLLALALGAVACLYTHYFAALPLAALSLYHLLFALPAQRRRGALRAWWAILGVFGLAGLLFVPWLQAFLAGLDLAMNAGGLQSRALDNLTVVSWLSGLFSNGHIALLAGLVALGIYAGRAPRPRRILLILVLLLAVALGINAALHLIEGTRVRYLITLWPLLALVVAGGFDTLRRWRFAPQVALGVWVALGLTGSAVPAYVAGLDSATYIFPMHDEAHLLRDRIQPGDYILSYLPPGLPEGRYQKQAAFYLGPLNTPYRTLQVQSPELASPFHAEVMASMGGPSRVWLASVPDHAPPDLGDLERQLGGDYTQCGGLSDRPGLRLDLYARSPVCCIPDTAPGAPELVYGDGATVRGSAVTLSPGGESVLVALAWAFAPEVDSSALSMALVLVDAAGETRAQVDAGIGPGSAICRIVTLPADGLAAGVYEVRLGVYPWQTGNRLPGHDLRRGLTSDLLTVGSIEVAP